MYNDNRSLYIGLESSEIDRISSLCVFIQKGWPVCGSPPPLEKCNLSLSFKKIYHFSSIYIMLENRMSYYDTGKPQKSSFLVFGQLRGGGGKGRTTKKI